MSSRKVVCSPNSKEVGMDGISRGANFSDCRKYRYALWRTWEEHKYDVAFIGLNPSTANEIEDDPTIRRCIRFAKDWGFGGLYMLNLFAYRATSPEELRIVSDPVGPENNEFLKKYCEVTRFKVVCWGNQGVLMERDKEVMELLGEETLSCLGFTKAGQPKHPLYLRRDTKLIKIKEPL